MASLLRPTRPFALPADAEVVTRDGRPHVRLTDGRKPVYYPLTKCRTKYLRPTGKWYGQYVDAAGVTRRMPLSANKDAARMMLAERVKQVEMERAGHSDPFRPHRKTPLTTHAEDWLSILVTRGRGDDYVALKRTRVKAILDGCGFVLPADLAADRLERFLDGLRSGPKRLSVQTTNDYLQAASQFCTWMVENERLERNPFVTVRKGNPERDRRHVRRVLDTDELLTLLAATRPGGVVRRCLDGEARTLLYATAAYTGYRAGELAALTVGGLVLDGPHPSADLDGRFTKNGKAAS